MPPEVLAHLTEAFYRVDKSRARAQGGAGLGLALSGAIVGEYLGSTQGMGWLLSAAGDVYNAQRVLCCVLVLVVLIILLDGVVRLLERRLLRWQ